MQSPRATAQAEAASAEGSQGLDDGHPDGDDRAVACFEVPASLAGQRLDHFLLARLESLGRSEVLALIGAGEVRIDGRRATKGTRLTEGQRVTLPAQLTLPIVGEPGASLKLVLERDDLVVIDKPAGQATAPLAPGDRGSVCGALLGRYPEMAGVGHRPREPGVLHRLDTGTSGLLLAARSTVAFGALWQAMETGKIDKSYLALVSGAALPDEGSISSVLSPGSQGRVHSRPATAGERPRSTRFQVLRRTDSCALVLATVGRAYRHQVRVHLATLGCPLLGDALYGGRDVKGLQRHALHASRIAWSGAPDHPAFDVVSELPDDLASVIG